jgi:1-acyl-sn-glycerol-3-phosphate acyltransferase
MVLRLNSPSFFEHLIWLPIRIFMRICCSAKIRGVQNVKQMSGNVIFASNHVTELDPLLIVASLPFFSDKLPIIYVVMETKAYRENWKSWRRFLYGGFFFRMIGGYEAYRGLNNYKKALRNHLEAIDENKTVCIFPVGRRHGVDEIGEARGGASFLAKETGLPIIPIHIQGISRITTAKDYLLRKPKLKITFGKPLYAEDLFSKPNKQVANIERSEFELR